MRYTLSHSVRFRPSATRGSYRGHTHSPPLPAVGLTCAADSESGVRGGEKEAARTARQAGRGAEGSRTSAGRRDRPGRG